MTQIDVVGKCQYVSDVWLVLDPTLMTLSVSKQPSACSAAGGGDAHEFNATQVVYDWRITLFRADLSFARGLVASVSF